MEATTTVNKKVVRKWVDALRSGEYPQDKGYLKTESGYCCLGVLCELATQEGIIGHSVRDCLDLGPRHEYDGERYFLPPTVAEWAGLPESYDGDDFDLDVRLHRDGEAKLASNLNDAGISFAEIADLIEKEYLTDGD